MLSSPTFVALRQTTLAKLIATLQLQGLTDQASRISNASFGQQNEWIAQGMGHPETDTIIETHAREYIGQVMLQGKLRKPKGPAPTSRVTTPASSRPPSPPRSPRMSPAAPTTTKMFVRPPLPQGKRNATARQITKHKHNTPQPPASPMHAPPPPPPSSVAMDWKETANPQHHTPASTSASSISNGGILYSNSAVNSSGISRFTRLSSVETNGGGETVSPASSRTRDSVEGASHRSASEDSLMTRNVAGGSNNTQAEGKSGTKQSGIKSAKVADSPLRIKRKKKKKKKAAKVRSIGDPDAAKGRKGSVVERRRRRAQRLQREKEEKEQKDRMEAEMNRLRSQLAATTEKINSLSKNVASDQAGLPEVVKQIRGNGSHDGNVQTCLHMAENTGGGERDREGSGGKISEAVSAKRSHLGGRTKQEQLQEGDIQKCKHTQEATHGRGEQCIIAPSGHSSTKEARDIEASVSNAVTERESRDKRNSELRKNGDVVTIKEMERKDLAEGEASHETSQEADENTRHGSTHRGPAAHLNTSAESNDPRETPTATATTANENQKTKDAQKAEIHNQGQDDQTGNEKKEEKETKMQESLASGISVSARRGQAEEKKPGSDPERSLSEVQGEQHGERDEEEDGGTGRNKHGHDDGDGDGGAGGSRNGADKHNKLDSSSERSKKDPTPALTRPHKRILVKSGYLLIAMEGVRLSDFPVSSPEKRLADGSRDPRRKEPYYKAMYVQILPIFSKAKVVSPRDEDISGMGLQVSDTPDSKDYVRYGLLGCNVEVGSEATEFVIHTQANEPLRAKAASVRARIGWVQTIGACSAPVSVIRKVYRHLCQDPIKALEEELEDLNFAIAAEGRSGSRDGVSPKRVKIFNKEIQSLSDRLAGMIMQSELESKSKHTLQLVEWDSAGGDDWPTTITEGEHVPNTLSCPSWLRGVAVTGVSASRVNLRVVTFYTIQAVAGSRDGVTEAKLVRFTKRFSQFLAMHAETIKWYQKEKCEAKLPEPPPKNSMVLFSGKRNSSFLNDRKADLERYINAMARVPHISTCEPFLDFIGLTTTSPH